MKEKIEAVQKFDSFPLTNVNSISIQKDGGNFCCVMVTEIPYSN